MKNSLYIIFVFLATQSFCQNSFFGLDAGLNVATVRQRLRDNGVQNANSYTVFYPNVVKPTLGFFYQKGFTNSLALRLQARYLEMGSRSIDPYPPYIKPIIEIDYLNFPLSLCYSINKHLSLLGGPYFSFFLDATKVNNQNISNTNDFGIMIGAEYDLYKNFALGINYFIGAKNIFGDGDTFSRSYSTTTNRALQFTLIYKFKKNN